jgi:hypothetical protein
MDYLECPQGVVDYKESGLLFLVLARAYKAEARNIWLVFRLKEKSKKGSA